MNVIDCDNFDLYTDIRRTWVNTLNMPFWGHITARGGHVLFKTRHQLTTVAIENIDFKASGYVLAPSSL
ncbi:hypothetical protein M3M33_15675, partial [Loigolactobacillus coryniformis]|uniref:hypothetical protein n=1 Tax=Loigolactobacillus coryniformis TaxID=1610 RepID=UPI00201A8EF3